MEKIRTHKDLKAYQLSFECGMAIFHRFGSIMHWKKSRNHYVAPPPHRPIAPSLHRSVVHHSPLYAHISYLKSQINALCF
jgi:hypothetical protein